MDLRFGPRSGDHANWNRWLSLSGDDGKPLGRYMLSMRTEEGTQVRTGSVKTREGRELWSGLCPDGPPPLRAFCLAAELCDDNGQSVGYPLPPWLR